MLQYQIVVSKVKAIVLSENTTGLWQNDFWTELSKLTKQTTDVSGRVHKYRIPSLQHQSFHLPLAPHVPRQSSPPAQPHHTEDVKAVVIYFTLTAVIRLTTSPICVSHWRSVNKCPNVVTTNSIPSRNTQVVALFDAEIWFLENKFWESPTYVSKHHRRRHYWLWICFHRKMCIQPPPCQLWSRLLLERKHRWMRNILELDLNFMNYIFFAVKNLQAAGKTSLTNVRIETVW